MNDARGERLLLAAVLVRAIRDLIKFSRSPLRAQRAVAEEAYDWLFADREVHHVTSFSNICVLMDFDHAAVRSAVRHWVASSRAVGSGAPLPAELGPLSRAVDFAR